MKAYQPISATNHRPAPSAVVAKYEHAQFAFLDDDEHVLPVFGLRTLPHRFPVLLAAEHAFFSPGRTQECELLVRDTNIGGDRVGTAGTTSIVLLCFSYDRMRQVRSKSEGRRQERGSGSINTLQDCLYMDTTR